ncbi:SDR family NAD(P)-dependent oxidoreductase [Holdemania massiliensis]|uniref:SDR family NAD(P)-dependent oxidoreductase n=1 Tax=Holdemania massiliensis TaxID=1468449 RepID=UPI001F06EBF2|nr:SDR family oxidoreductase [Holdemania massiliensis]MCH1940996.1 SDR family oxidoreductase [Holdemania massiliensis]
MMKSICVISGGGSGMGLEAAKILGQKHKIILMGRTVSKLENAVKMLHDSGIEAEAYPADASQRESVRKLAEYAAQQGEVKVLIHAAGVSPHMTDAQKIFEINAMGTMNMDEEFVRIMPQGSCILNVSSMSAYMLPSDKVPKPIYKLSLTDREAFRLAVSQMLDQIPAEQQTGTAYTLSKNFVLWYTSRMAVMYGKQGIRVVSISPGTFKTPMGEIEGQEAASFAERGALGRMGEPEEIARMMAFMVSEECSYLTGVDILYDGGSVAAMQAMREDRSH